MRRIGVVTVGRSDFGLYLPLLRRIAADPSMTLQLFVSGAHLARSHGLTVRQIEAAGFTRYVAVPMLAASDRPVGIGVSMGRGVGGFARAYARHRPDLLVVLGDRFEMHAAALAALPFRIPVAHIHGGEITQGAIDDALRHSLTKLSHLHFPSTAAYGRRLRQLGEEPWRIRVVGALGLDNLRDLRVPDRTELGRRIGWALPESFVLATYHPVTLEYDQTEWQAGQWLAALGRFGLPVLFTAPNADTHGRIINRSIQRFLTRRPQDHYVENLGTESYFGVMAAAVVMVGNSSSGLIEAASFQLPVVNVGTRQSGRLRPANVIDCGNSERAILGALRRAAAPRFRRLCRRVRNPYDGGGAATRIIRVLASVDLGDRLVRKRFRDHGRVMSFA